MPQVNSEQIQDGTIVNADINSAANITLTKLQNGNRIALKETNGDFIVNGTLSVSGNQINNVASNTDSAGAINYAQLTGAVSAINATINANQSDNLQASDWVPFEVPSGAINGTNKDFVLANAPREGKVQVFHNGLLDKNFTVNSSTVTMTTAPLTGSEILVSYFKA